jgi:hypothetical protein
MYRAGEKKKGDPRSQEGKKEGKKKKNKKE